MSLPGVVDMHLGTALMLQINHRESFAIDILVNDPQVLPYLSPATQGYTLQVNSQTSIESQTLSAVNVV